MSGAYASQFNAIFRAIKTNLSRITVANGFGTTVVAVHERDDPIRPGDFTGPVLKVTDTEELVQYLTASERESQITYTVEGFIYNASSATMRSQLRTFVSDFIAAFDDDTYLSNADLLNGGAGNRLVKLHRIKRVLRQYVLPNAYFRAELEARFCWNGSV